ncbi:unnamed protein product [Bathycoccus prasinos]
MAYNGASVFIHVGQSAQSHFRYLLSGHGVAYGPKRNGAKRNCSVTFIYYDIGLNAFVIYLYLYIARERV